MTTYYLSPLRYPGGKAALAPYLGRLIAGQFPRVTEYAEPFAGGAGAALRLLVDEVVRIIHLNDLDPGIAAMWRSIVTQSELFAERILCQEATIQAWESAKSIYQTPGDHDDFELGFATFLLNRWNRSGIIAARPIGGLDQTGQWKIDARFNRANLAERVRFIGEYRSRIRVSEADARVFISELESTCPDTLLYVDPPYLVQGDDLYLDTLSIQDHEELAQQLRSTAMRWLLTYDVDRRITEELYPDLRCAEFRIAHTAQTQHIGREYMVFGNSVAVADLEVLKQASASWIS